MTPYEKHSLQLLTFILNAQNLQLQGMRQSPELSDVILQHLQLSGAAVQSLNSTFEAELESSAEGEAASGD